MNVDQQAQILDIIRTRRAVYSRELIRECQGWDFRKAITRLRRKGFPIVNVSPAGREAKYCWMPTEASKEA
jgi:hypothetical protein